MDVVCTLCFLGNNSQHMTVYAKDSSWLWKVLGIAKAHLSPGTLCRAVMSAVLATSVSLVSVL